MNARTSGLATFLGAPMQQTWADLALWERVLNDLPGLRGIIELGTGSGAFSAFLLLQCQARQLNFETFDKAFGLCLDQDLLGLGDYCHVLDIFEKRDALAEVFASSREGRRTTGGLLLFCDDGNKPAEVATFGPLLIAGDVLAVHDWGTEIGPRDLACMDGRLAELAEGEMTKWWRVV